jgi:radical SAM protein with 4Fe4S-binding SPASM domain
MNTQLKLSHPLNLFELGSSYLLSRLTKKPTVWGTPVIAMIEPTNRCNLTCPLCHVGSGKLKRQPRNLKLEEFKIILNRLPGTVRVLQLWNQGEPFMNPQFLEMVRLASDRGYHTITSTNAQFLNRNGTAQAVVDAGLGELVVSLDDIEPESYASIRSGGDLPTVLEGINAVYAEKAGRNMAIPQISAQCLLLRQVEDHLDQVRLVAEQSGADRVVWKTAQVSSLDEAREVLPKNEKMWRYRIANGELTTKRQWEGCLRTWFSTVILCDGSVVPCCFDKDGEYVMGNLLTQSFEEIWRGSHYMEFRKQTMRRRAYPICNNCTEGLSKLYVKAR